MKPLSKLFADVTKSVGSSGIQFALTIISTPLMTRLYDPSAYATFGIIMSAVAAVVGIGMLSLPSAYPAEKESVARRELLKTMLLLLGLLVALGALASIIVAAADDLHSGIHISGTALAFFPVLIFTSGIRQILTNIAIGRAHFNSTSLSQIVEPICSRGSSIGLGFLAGGHPAFILFSTALGQVIASVAICHMLLKEKMWLWQSYRLLEAKPMATLRRHKDSIFFNTISQQALVLVLLFLQIGIATFFSGELAGQYILATSIVTMPATLIALATSPVVYRHFIEVERNSPKKLANHLLAITAIYLLVGLCLLSPVFFFGEIIFKFAFGEKWGHAGVIASTLSAGYMLAFVAIGVQAIFRVTKQMKLQFVIDFFGSAVLFFIGIFFMKNMSFESVIFCFSLIWFLRNMVLLCASIFVVYKKYVQYP